VIPSPEQAAAIPQTRRRETMRRVVFMESFLAEM
jgi:hypothetical protein